MSNRQRLIPLLRQLYSQNEQTVYDQIVSLIENKNFDPTEVEASKSIRSEIYSPLIYLIKYLGILQNKPNDDVQKNRFIDISHKLLESGLARIEYISPRIKDTALMNAIYNRLPELAIQIIDKSTYGAPYLNQKHAVGIYSGYTPLMLAIRYFTPFNISNADYL
jgi:hypothetical protein